jgi:hypothetical protein
VRAIDKQEFRPQGQLPNSLHHGLFCGPQNVVAIDLIMRHDTNTIRQGPAMNVRKHCFALVRCQTFRVLEALRGILRAQDDRCRNHWASQRTTTSLIYTSNIPVTGGLGVSLKRQERTPCSQTVPHLASSLFSREAFLLNTGSPATQFAQIKKFRPPYTPVPHQLQGIDFGRMQRKNAFDTNPIGYLPHRERAAQTAPLYRNHDAFERLYPFSCPFNDTNVDPQRISRTKLWEILLHLSFVNMR